ncbi:TPA_asm: M [Ilex alphacytorhabdovirus 1]|nr:TPA_asm: M [Ilex alphacytorhabdovirus 1]
MSGDSKWVKIKFEQINWYYDCMQSAKRSVSKADSSNQVKAMAKGFLASKIMPLNGNIANLLANMVQSGHVRFIQTVGRSMHAGAGSRRCCYRPMTNIVIPTRIDFQPGTETIDNVTQDIKVDGVMYKMNFQCKIGVALMSSDEAELLFKFKPKEFIGQMDSIFEQTETTNPSSSTDQSTSKKIK